MIWRFLLALLGAVSIISHDFLNIAVWHANNAYCISNTFLHSKYTSNNFTGVSIINETVFGTVGYIGYSNENNYLVIAFKGSEQMHQDIIDSALIPYPSCDNCLVNKVFSSVEKLLFEEVKDQVNKLLQMNSQLEIVVTGHAYGRFSINICLHIVYIGAYAVHAL